MPPLFASKQTLARIDFLQPSERLADKKALIKLNLLLKTIQKNYAVNTRGWATTQKTCRLATASASGCGGCCSRPTKTTSWKSRSNLPLTARLSTCRERMEQLPPSRLLKHTHVLPQTIGAIFQVLSYPRPVYFEHEQNVYLGFTTQRKQTPSNS